MTDPQSWPVCQHDSWHWCLRTHGNQSRHVVAQCLKCGVQIGGAIPKDDRRLIGLGRLPLWNADLADAYATRLRSGWRPGQTSLTGFGGDPG